MTDTTFLIPSEAPPEEHDPTKVRRDATGRPYVRVRCVNDSQHVGFPEDEDYLPGRVASEKRPGKTVQCPKCKGKGYQETRYTRATTFVGVLDDRSALEKWQKRVVLYGIALDVTLDNALGEVDYSPGFDSDEVKAELNRLADLAFTAGDGHAKAQKGTDLHSLSELVDTDRPFPATLVNEEGYERPVTNQDRADMGAYTAIMTEIGVRREDILGMETFVVNDEYETAGTYDRRVRLGMPCCDRPRILDLKTGRVDYGAGKMAMQLSIYANAKGYVPETGERVDLDTCHHWGIIVHVPQGTGTAYAYAVDLVKGYEAVHLASLVREHRRVAQGFMIPLGEVGTDVQG